MGYRIADVGDRERLRQCRLRSLRRGNQPDREGDRGMTMHTLYCASYHPRIHMAEIEGKRRSQIVATLMADLHSRNTRRPSAGYHPIA